MYIELFLDGESVASLEIGCTGCLVKSSWSKDIVSVQEDHYIIQELEKDINYPDPEIYLNGKKLTYLWYDVNEKKSSYNVF